MKKLNDKEKIFLLQYYEFKKDYPNICFYIKYICLFLFIIPTIIFISYFIGERGYVLIYTNLSIGDALSFYGSVLSFLGTISLGIVALWQNHKANQINLRLLNITEDTGIPTIDIMQCNYDEFKKIDLNQVIEININDTDIILNKYNEPEDYCNPFFVFKVKNVKNNDILSINVKNINCINQLAVYSKDAEFKNIKNIHNDIFNVSYNIDKFILTRQSECYLFISGCNYEIPKNSNTYVHQGLQFNLEFELTNYTGKIYIQKIEFVVNSSPIHMDNIVKCPFIIYKKILSIQEISYDKSK